MLTSATPRRYASCLLLLLAACATPTGAGIPRELLDPAPLAGVGADLTVLGLSCPNCSTNIDLKLKALAGVERVNVDLGTGHVAIDFTATGPRPSRQDLAIAVRDSGFTIVAIEPR